MKTAFFLAGILCCVATVSAQQLETNLQQIFEDFQLMGMSVWTYVDGDEQVFSFGLKDFTRNLEVDENTKYRIASISKTSSALALMNLYEEGFLDLDEDISTYLGYTVINPSHPGIAVTARMLMSHTSSLQDGSGYNGFLSATYTQNPIPDIAQLLVPGGSFYTSNMWRTETPGTYFAYSNLNFGVIATLVEVISQQRFDIYIREQILQPLGISGSYYIQDIPDINDIAVLYRNQGGWTPQVDNYQGVMPAPPSSLASYTPGTNGSYFAPQGGLRASASEIGKLITFIKTNGLSVPGILSSDTLEMMKTIQWDFNGSNGDNYFGLFNRWGLGIHHANLSIDDQICPNLEYGSFLGHPGEANGLISDAYFSENENIAFSFLTNGSFQGYQIGNYSSYYTLEEAVFQALCAYFSENLSLSAFSEKKIQVFPNPSSDMVEVHLQMPVSLQYSLRDMHGKRILSKEETNVNRFSFSIDFLSPGVYFLTVNDISGNSFHQKVIKK